MPDPVPAAPPAPPARQPTPFQFGRLPRAALLKLPSLSRAALLLYAYLSATGAGRAFERWFHVPDATLRSALALGRSTVKRARRQLYDAGLLWYDSGTGKRPCRYLLCSVGAAVDNLGITEPRGSTHEPPGGPPTNPLEKRWEKSPRLAEPSRRSGCGKHALRPNQLTLWEVR